jgi:hypothetical protein
MINTDEQINIIANYNETLLFIDKRFILNIA